MKTYQITLPDETAAMVEKMLQDGPWETADQLFADGVGTLQEDVLTEDEMGLDYEEVKRKLREAEESLDQGLGIDGEEFFREMLERRETKNPQATV